GDRIGNDVFELAQLVAAEREPGIAILALGVELDLAAEMGAEPLQLLDMGRSESEWIAFEFFQHARMPFRLWRRSAQTNIDGEKGALEDGPVSCSIEIS